MRDKLPKSLKKIYKILLRSPRITSSAFLLAVFIFASFFASAEPAAEISRAQTARTFEKSKITPYPSEKKYVISGEVAGVEIVPTQTPTPIPSLKNISDEKTEGEIKASGNSSDLLSEVNKFRSSNGVGLLSSSGSLCNIANSRLSEIKSQGSLDNHAGFNKYFQEQSEFNGMGEILFQSSYIHDASVAVNQGWAKSTAGHRENMIDPKWNYGCGASDGYFSVFNFGKK